MSAERLKRLKFGSHGWNGSRNGFAAVAIVLLIAGSPARTLAWGAQGHRLVALLAAERLTPTARRNVTWLLGPESLADVSSWADRYLEGNYQTFYWHFLNIPSGATSYDRDRDCPRQPGVDAGGRGDQWRDCAVDRILYNKARLADTTLDRADRAIALKFLVHFVGDLHQPFHALGVGHGGNDIRVTVFGSEICGNYPCNLHGVWDGGLIAHRGLDDAHYLPLLRELLQDGAQIFFEAHLEHPIGLVEHQQLQRVEPQVLLVQERAQAAWGADDDVRPVLERVAVGAHRHPAVQRDQLDVGRGARERSQLACDLIRKLTRRTDHQRLHLSHVGPEALEQGQAERGGLAAAGLGLRDQVLALQHRRQGSGLDRRHLRVPEADQVLEQRR